MGGSGEAKFTRKYDVYISGLRNEMHLMYVAYFEKEKTNMRLNIFYHLQSVWILAQCVFHTVKLTFKRTPVAAKRI